MHMVVSKIYSNLTHASHQCGSTNPWFHGANGNWTVLEISLVAIRNGLTIHTIPPTVLIGHG